jgi:catechol 2,3-dioxygenase-like lactoylglutathione lyase family enzyme
MTVELNHTIVHSIDRHASAQFLVDLLGLKQPTTYGPFVVVELGNGVTLDFADDFEIPHPQHYAFLVSEQDFDQIFGRVKARRLDYWADPGQSRHGEINRLFGGRGVYFEDPAGNLLEIITRPYADG